MDVGQNTQSKESWTRSEEDALLKILEDIVANGGKCDNGTIRFGTMSKIERALQELCPDARLKVNPHIDSKMRKGKKTYGFIYDMMNNSDFAWNDITKCIEVDSNEAWQAYVQHNRETEEWRRKPFPFYDRLANIFGKDRATGRGVETPADMKEDVNREEENLDNMGGDGMNNIVDDDSSSMSVHNRSTATSSHSRKRNRSGDDNDATPMAAFKKMFKVSVQQLSVMTDKLVKGNEDCYDISTELDTMRLFEEEHLEVFQAIINKPQYVSTFKSFNGAFKERFVRKLLRQIKGGAMF